MQNVILLVQENWLPVTIVAVVLLPLLYATRRWITGPIQWIIELGIYMTLVHVAIHYIVKVARWFNYNSQMEMLADRRVMKTWETPLTQFWDRSLYDPEWVFYLELGFVVFAFILMVKLRPMKTQRKAPKREPLRKGQGMAGKVRPPLQRGNR